MQIDIYLDVQQARVPDDVLEDKQLPEIRSENSYVALRRGSTKGR